MCGIAGVLGFQPGSDGAALSELAKQMSRRIIHRGPDDDGVWVEPHCGLALAFRRLSILDLTPSGHQPMVSHLGRFVVIFNGEIYNHREIRSTLANHPFRGHSDTEVMLAAFDEWGIEQALQRFNGMFALAVWDRQARTLTLARDRLGEKPLYYGHWRGHLLFASELKALFALEGFVPTLDRNSLALYMRHGYIPTPYSVYEGFKKLVPGTFVTFAGPDHSLQTTYWSAGDTAEHGQQEPLTIDRAQAVELVHDTLQSAVQLRMEADVPLGAFLSGGIDSSLVVALMQTHSSIPVRTFSLGFSHHDYDEAPFARAVAEHLGTAHTEFYVTPSEALTVIPRLPTIYDEPFADSSQIPTFLVCALARQHVTVSLSGDGGDELFGGYVRYSQLARAWKRLGSVPARLRRLGAQSLLSLSPAAWNRYAFPLTRMLPLRDSYRQPGDRLHRIGRALAFHDAEDLYMHMVSAWDDLNGLVLGGQEYPTALNHAATSSLPDGAFRRAMFLDSVSYLPDDILVKVDRAAMSVGLETRMPMLDHNLYDLAWRIPSSYQVDAKRSKPLLRELLGRYIPAAMIDRPKMGFGVPVGAWIRGPLRPWADDLLSHALLEAYGVLNPDVVTSVFRRHLAGQVDLAPRLWPALMLQAWLQDRARSVIAP